MNATAKIGLLGIAGFVVLCLGGKHLLENSAQATLVRSFEQRPYTDRDLGAEYGLARYSEPSGRGGPLAHMSIATAANKRNNMLEVEASRIQLEFESKSGMSGFLLSAFFESASINPSAIARQRFEDQGLLPKR